MVFTIAQEVVICWLTSHSNGSQCNDNTVTPYTTYFTNKKGCDKFGMCCKLMLYKCFVIGFHQTFFSIFWVGHHGAV